jgi:hypothetical protein
VHRLARASYSLPHGLDALNKHYAPHTIALPPVRQMAAKPAFRLFHIPDLCQ